MSVERLMLRGGAVSYGIVLAGKAFLYGATLLLARLLAPQDFGLVGFSLVVLSVFDVVSDLGIPSAFIYQTDTDDGVAGEAFLLCVLAGIGCCLACWAAAGPVSVFFGDRRVIPITEVLATTFVLSGLGAIHRAMLQKRMKFGRRFLPDLVLAVIKGGVSIGLAFHGAGYWSLAWGQVAGEAAQTTCCWALMPWRPRLSFRWASARPLLAYGWQISFVGILGVLLFNGDYAIVGHSLGATGLGLYTVAYAIPQMVTISLAVAFSQVLFPAYSRIRADIRQLQDTYLSLLRRSAWVLMPVGIGLCVTSTALMHTLYQPEWWPAVTAMQALSVYGMLYAIGWHTGDVLKAIGRPDVLWKLSLSHVLILLPALSAGAWLDGITGVAIAHLIVAVPYSAVRFWVAHRFFGIDTRAIFSSLRPPTLATSVMAVVCVVMMAVDIPAAGMLVCQTVLGAAVYIGTMALVEPEVRPLLRFGGRIVEMRRPFACVDLFPPPGTSSAPPDQP